MGCGSSDFELEYLFHSPSIGGDDDDGRQGAHTCNPAKEE